jgi:hypothetical protein
VVQLPQWVGSVCVFAQVAGVPGPAGHDVAGAVHTHAPLTQLPPEPQRFPQAPQLFTSVW